MSKVLQNHFTKLITMLIVLQSTTKNKLHNNTRFSLNDSQLHNHINHPYLIIYVN